MKRFTPSPRKRELLLRLLLLAIAAVVVARSFAWQQVAGSLREVRLPVLIPVVLFITPATVVLRSLRWKMLTPSAATVPLTTFIRAYLVGFLANAVLLGKFGDIVKAKSLSNAEVRFSSSAASALVDRLFEGLALLLVAGACFLNGSFPHWMQRAALITVALSIALGIGLFLSYRHRANVEQWLLRALSGRGSLQGRVTGIWRGLADGMHAIGSAPKAALAILLSLLIWSLEVAAVSSFLLASSIGVPLIAASVAVLLGLNFGTLLPVSPGSVGIYQVICALVLSTWGIARETGFGFGLLMQAVLFVPVYLAGAIALGTRRRGSPVAAVTVS